MRVASCMIAGICHGEKKSSACYAL